MQLYEVSFKITHEDTYEIGKCIVSGHDIDDAILKATFHLELDQFPNRSFNVAKLKPQIYQLDRRTIKKHQSETQQQTNITVRKFKSTYVVILSAEVFTENNDMALQIIRQFMTKLSRNPHFKDSRIPLFEMEIEEKNSYTQGMQQANIDKQAMFKETTIFRG